MANIINEQTIKIDRPKTEDGWTWGILQSFGFNFRGNKKIVTNWKIVLKILNKALPYFYLYTAIEQYYSNQGTLISENIKKIIIDDDILSTIAIESTKNTSFLFSKSIFDYADFVPNIIKKSEFHQIIQEEIIEKNLEEEKYNKVQETFIAERNLSTQIAMRNKAGGIYGIYSLSSEKVKKLLYIGLTSRPLIQRWTEHLNITNGISPTPKGMDNLYTLLRARKNNYELLIDLFVDFDTIQTNRPLSQNEKEAMELGFISALQPIGNIAGTKIPYQFSNSQ